VSACKMLLDKSCFCLALMQTQNRLVWRSRHCRLRLLPKLPSRTVRSCKSIVPVKKWHEYRQICVMPLQPLWIRCATKWFVYCGIDRLFRIDAAVEAASFFEQQRFSLKIA